MSKMSDWGDRHYPRWLTIIRIALGLFLVYKSIQFMVGVEKIQSIPGGIDSVLYYVMLFHLVIFIHFVGGVFISIGLFTRLSAIIQIPMIIGALVLVTEEAQAVLPGGQFDQIISIPLIVLLAVFLVFGSGSYSIDSKRIQQAKSNLSPA